MAFSWGFPVVRTGRVFKRFQCEGIIRDARGKRPECYRFDVSTGRKLAKGQNNHDAWEVSPHLTDYAYVVFERMAWLIDRANKAAFGFDIDLKTVSARVLRYRTGQRNDLHLDHGGRDDSKLTAVVCLLGSFDSGRSIFLDQSPVTLLRGCGLVFPSTYPHGCSPVLDGERWMLAAWVSGPRFK